MDRYGTDVLAGDWRAPRRGRARAVPAEPGLVVEQAETGWCGAVVRVETAGGLPVVHLQDRHGRSRGFPLGSGYLLDGAPVVLTRPVAAAGRALAAARAATARTASGSSTVPSRRAVVAAASRLWVEGRHDAELVEKVWGADLRVEGIVVEAVDGVDDLVAAVRHFRPTPRRRLGVLVDHLVPGTKEAAIVARVRAHPAYRPGVLVLGHPFVDVWQTVRPDRLGLSAWPVVPPGRPWKEGVCRALGWPHATQADLALAWRRVLGAVSTYSDLEPALLSSVEALIDFVTVGPLAPGAPP